MKTHSTLPVKVARCDLDGVGFFLYIPGFVSFGLSVLCPSLAVRIF